tara:strand:+ start:4629 stop:5042 length:414 start_codon:yes stop_codon:yes gene_type:complete
MDTIETFRQIAENAEIYFGDNSAELTDAINEYIHDFIDDTDGEERIHPEGLIFQTDRVALQSAGFYGSQLNLKERQVTAVNGNLRAAIGQRVTGVFKAPFKKWVGVINNFIGSLEITGVGSALKEIKDCLRDELPDE